LSICWEELSLPNNSFVEPSSACFISEKQGAVYLSRGRLGFIDVNKRKVSNIVLPSGYLAVSMFYGLTFYWDKIWVVLHKREDKILRLFSYNYDVNYKDRWCEYRLPSGVTISEHSVIYGNPSYEGEEGVLVCSFTQGKKDKIFLLDQSLTWGAPIDLPELYNVVGTSGDGIKPANFLRFHQGVHLCLTNTHQQNNIVASLGVSYSLFPQGNPKGSTSYWGKEPTDALLRISGGSCAATEDKLFEVLINKKNEVNIYEHIPGRFKKIGLLRGDRLNRDFPLIAWDKRLVVCVQQNALILKSYDVERKTWEDIASPKGSSICPSFQARSDGRTLICGFKKEGVGEVRLYMRRV